MKTQSKWLIAMVLVIGLTGAVFFWWQQRHPTTAETLAATQPLEPAAKETPATTPAPSIRHPLEMAQDAATNTTLDNSDRVIQDALEGLLDRKKVLAYVITNHFVRHAVATVDNLGRDHAALLLWPVHPTPGRLLVLERGDDTYLADGNSDRYTAFVRFVAAIDPSKAAALYRRFYSLFQQAYAELGYPKKYFNDRLIEVIDLLVATPELDAPTKLTLTQVQGSVPSERPWVRYEFANPDLQALPSGQKILLRMGQANAQVLKKWLLGFRKSIAISNAPQ
jgi:hypothetical protein